MAVKSYTRPTKSLKQLRQEGKLQDLIDALKESLAPFDAEQLGINIEAAYEDFLNKGVQWAKNTQERFVIVAPFLTGNLRDSITVDDSNLPNEIFVGVDFAKLQGPKSKTVIRRSSKSYGKDITIPAYDYTAEADEVNVSAGGTALDAEGPGTPFIEELWLNWAYSEARRLFN